MFQQLTLLCLSAVLDAAQVYEHIPKWEGSVMYYLPTRHNSSEHYFSDDPYQHGTRPEIRNAQLHDATRSNEDFVLIQNHENAPSAAIPRKRLNVDQQEKTYNSTENSRNTAVKDSSRGLFKNLQNSIRQKGLVFGVNDAMKNIIGSALGFVNETAKITKDFLKGTTKIAKDVVHDSAKLKKDIVVGSMNITKKTIGWLTAKTIQIGKRLVATPLHSIELKINKAWAAYTLGAGMTAQIISDTADWFQGNWDAVKAKEFPGKNLIVMLYPSGLMSVLNRITKEIMYMLDAGHRMLTHAFGYTLYESLKIVFEYVSQVIQLNNLDCIPLPPQQIKARIVGTIRTQSGKACGISHMKPVNNVTITRSDDKFLIVRSPWIMEDLSVHLTGVKVTGGGETLLDNETMDTKIKKLKATGTVSFEAGTLLRFVRIHIQIDDMEELKVKFPTKHKSYLMEYMETLSNYFSGLMREEVNRMLETIETKTFDYIANI